MDNSTLEPIDWEALGRRIKIALQGNRVVEIADKIGIAKTNIYKWIKAEKHPSLENIFSFSSALSRPVSVQWLVSGVEPQYLDQLFDLRHVESIDSSNLADDIYGCALLRNLPPDSKAVAIAMIQALSRRDTNEPRLEGENIYTYQDLIEMLKGMKQKASSQAKIQVIDQVIEMVQRKFIEKSKRANSQ